MNLDERIRKLPPESREKLREILDSPEDYNPYLDFPTGRYKVIVIDPPWVAPTSRSKKLGSELMPYSTLSIRQLARLPVKSIAAEDSTCWLWRVNKFAAEAVDLLWAWGYQMTQELIWVKSNSGKLQIGMGSPLRNCHESCLVGVRGKVSQNDRGIPSVLFAPRSEHSRKPDKFYELVMKLSDGPYIDLFGRVERQGWTVWGNCVGGYFNVNTVAKIP